MLHFPFMTGNLFLHLLCSNFGFPWFSPLLFSFIYSDVSFDLFQCWFSLCYSAYLAEICLLLLIFRKSSFSNLTGTNECHCSITWSLRLILWLYANVFDCISLFSVHISLILSLKRDFISIYANTVCPWWDMYVKLRLYIYVFVFFFPLKRYIRAYAWHSLRHDLSCRTQPW